MVAFPNPDGIEIHFAQLDGRNDIGDIWQAARAARVKPGTIRVWMTRGKIAPLLRGEAGDLFHLPTIKKAAAAGSKYAPADPAANSRGHHTRQAA
ncbi:MULTISPECIES: hypothetical protein [Streptomyces]|uniref:hypothetical protein n=1 Tax=Streptomyces TaxID=1883 RepID=UPI000F7B27B4|nr:hypothetical protein [Streptomyces sp. WAC05858]RSS45436.1 hypothetical protein EF902_14080 [Streptomyces sp. WAC05858]WTA79207.1 hypothetical protein OG751_04035 [Streptomyces antimycoticus]